MRIFVFNLSRHRVIKIVTAMTLCVLIVLSVTIGITTKILGRTLLETQADALPYDKIIILDPGHGGEDPGAIGNGNIYEKELNLQLALEIGRLLEEKGYIVVYTRTDDRLLLNEDENIKGIKKISDLKNRCKVAERYPDSLFVSIHMNSFSSSKYSGLQVYHSKDDKSRVLADSIQSKVISDLQPSNNRSIKQGDGMYLLENISNPAVLIECGFMTNEEELKKLSEKEYQKQLSFSIVCGIIEYIEKINLKKGI